MKSIDELPDLMVELIENTTAEDDHIEFPGRAREIIKEISDFAQSTKIYSRNRKRSKTFWENDATPTDIYYFMIQKVVDAPTQIHRDAAVLLHMPALAEAIIKQERGEIEDG